MQRALSGCCNAAASSSRRSSSIRRTLPCCSLSAPRRRSLATAAATTSDSSSAPTTDAAAATKGRRARLSTEDGGPTLDDFIAGTEFDAIQRVKLGNTATQRLPSYLKSSIPTSASYNKIKNDLRGLNLHTVCEEARCPNIGQCWSGDKGDATATIMVSNGLVRLPSRQPVSKKLGQGQAGTDTAASCNAAHGRYVHARLQVLRSQDVEDPTAARSSRAREHGRGDSALGRRLHSHDDRRQRW